MQPVHPHGESRRLLSLLGDDTTIEMVGYADGAFGIIQDGRLVGTWLASEELECVKAFHQLCDFHEANPCFVMSRASFGAALAATLAARATRN